MSIQPLPIVSGLRPIGLLLAGALTGLVVTAACSSDSKSDSATGGASAEAGADSGGTSASAAGKAANDAGKSANGGTPSDGAAGVGAASDGGATDAVAGGGGGGGITATAGTSSGGAGTAGSGTAGSGGAGTLPGDNVWACVAAGTSCICQNNANARDASTCTGTYPCCFAVPLGASTRCQCQDPGTSKCSDLAGFFGSGGRVVDHCPP